MAEKDGKRSWVMVNRAPVLTLWAAVVAEVLGFEHDEALTLGRAVAGLNAYSKGVSLGLFQPTPREVKEQRRKMRKEETVTIDLLHRAVPAKNISRDVRADACWVKKYGVWGDLVSKEQRIKRTLDAMPLGVPR